MSEDDRGPNRGRALLEDPTELSSFGGWQEAVYRDLLALQSGTLATEAFDARYLRRIAILVLDLTGFSESAMHGGSIRAFLRILNAQKVLIPVLLEHGASRVYAFADDLVGLFDAPEPALAAALEMHRLTGEQRADPATPEGWPDCCIGIGWGPVYEIGPNRAMGDEMNRVSRLGEDIARGGETLLTEGAWKALADRRDVRFARATGDDVPFPYYRVVTRPV